MNSNAHGSRDPHGENPTEAFLNTLGQPPRSDGGMPQLPVIEVEPAAAADGADAPEAPLEGSDAEAYAALKRRRAKRRKKKLIRRGIAAGIVLAAVGIGTAAAIALARAPETGPLGPMTETATAGTFSDSVDAKGTLEPNASTVVSPGIDGTIESVEVRAGDTVEKGDVLMTIKNAALGRAVKEAERALKSAKAGLAEARQQLKAAKRMAQGYPASTEITDGLGGDSNPAAAQVDTTAAQSAVDAAQLEVEAAQATYDDAVATAAQRTVKAPASGSIVAMNAQVGASLSEAAAGALSGDGTGGPLLQIADLSKMKVTVQVGEEDIARVKQGQKASITFPAFEGLVLEGKVTGIASVASADGGMMAYDGSSTPAFAVDVLISKPDKRLKPGMTAEVTLTTQQLDNVVMVPVSALMTDDGETYYVNVQTGIDDSGEGGTDAGAIASERRDVEVVAKNDDVAVVGRMPDAPAKSNPDMVTSPVADGDTLVVSGGMDMSGTAADGGTAVM